MEKENLKHRIRLEVSHTMAFHEYPNVRVTIFLDGEKKGGIMRLPDDFELSDLEEALNKMVRMILETYRKMSEGKEGVE